MRATSVTRIDAEDRRRSQLIEATIQSLADLGFVACTLGDIARRAGTSAGLVAHYFGDKDGLLEAAMRHLVGRLRRHERAALAAAVDARARISAIVEANLAPEEFDRRTSGVWLAFWAQVMHNTRFRRVQNVYQRRMQSNLVHALKSLASTDEARVIASEIGALIDGYWLRAALSDQEPDTAQARQAVSAYVDARLAMASPLASPVIAKPRTHFLTINPANGETLAEIAISSQQQVEDAVSRARIAQRDWTSRTGAERGRILRRVADLLRERNPELAQLETLDTGKPIQETIAVDVLSGADCIEYFAGIAAGLAGEHVDLGPNAFGYTRREALGVVAGIGAWNYPIQIACWKAAPALAAGNAMIFKPAELTPLTAIELEKIMLEAGVPAGVFQIVQGFGETGRMLSLHPDIAKISLTGEVGTGKKVMADAATTLKQVTLELGGKSPLIVFEDADLDDAVSAAMLGNFYSAGEVCSNGTRVFVHKKIRKAFVERLAARTQRMVIGDPLDPATQVGALISENHMNKVLSYITRGRSEGAKLIAGGNRATKNGLGKGFFVEPTIFDGCDDGMAIVREEIFGPVMSILTFETEAEVVTRANATRFGLSAGVFTRDLARGHRVVAALEAGTCWINHYNMTPIELPFGGVKQSGLGRENSKAALEHYTQLKSVYVNLARIDAPY